MFREYCRYKFSECYSSYSNGGGLLGYVRYLVCYDIHLRCKKTKYTTYVKTQKTAMICAWQMFSSCPTDTMTLASIWVHVVAVPVMHPEVVAFLAWMGLSRCLSVYNAVSISPIHAQVQLCCLAFPVP